MSAVTSYRADMRDGDLDPTDRLVDRLARPRRNQLLRHGADSDLRHPLDAHRHNGTAP